MLSRPPTRLELTQADVDEYNELREFAQEARADKRSKDTDSAGAGATSNAVASNANGERGAGEGTALEQRRRRVGL